MDSLKPLGRGVEVRDQKHHKGGGEDIEKKTSRSGLHKRSLWDFREGEGGKKIPVW